MRDPMKDQSLSSKCQAKHPCSIDSLSHPLKDFTVAKISPLLKTMNYSSLRVINIDKYTGSESAIWKKQTTKIFFLFFWTFHVLPFFTSLNSQMSGDNYLYPLPQLLSYLHLTSVGFSLFPSMTPME